MAHTTINIYTYIQTIIIGNAIVDFRFSFCLKLINMKMCKMESLDNGFKFTKIQIHFKIYAR